MARFEVWAPGKDRVELVLEGGERLAMAPSELGWWTLEVPGAGPGTRYRLSPDGGPPRPDPRSAYQPEGVDGPSELVDHASFNWSDATWEGFELGRAVLYEMHVGTFSPEGTFDGAVGRLGHLVDLGVNAVELMPVAEASGARGWGYDGADLWAPHHCYGGPDGLKRLVDACHGHGLAVVLDVVYNHLGPAGNYLAEFGPYFTDRYRTPWGTAVNMDGAGSYGVRDFVVANALMWLGDYHLDGLRLDAVHAIYDEGALHVLEELSQAVDLLAQRQGRHLWLMAESDRNDPRLVRSRAEHGYGVHAAWDDDLHHALHCVLTGEEGGYYSDFGQLGQLAKALSQGYVYDGSFSPFRQRRHGRPAVGLPGQAFVVCMQNHDQVGNRAFGERISSLVGADLAAVGAALYLLSPYVPLVFQGEEWGASTPFQYFTDHRDPDLARAVSEGRRREHAMEGAGDVPDPQDEGTFLRSRLDWSEPQREPHRWLLGWYKRLLELRRSEPALGTGRPGDVVTAHDEQGRWLSVRRGGFSIVANLAEVRQPVPLGGGGAVVVSSAPGVVVEIGASRSPGPPGHQLGRGSAAAGGPPRAWLPPRSVAVVAH